VKQSCELVKDLLPLYHDGVCSEQSKQLVEEHLAECPSCKNELQKMNNKIYDNQLSKERENVVARHTEKVRKASLTAGIAVSAVMAVPILVCLIVNLATGHALDWFFIVLTSLMVLASVTVVPMVIEERKLLWTIGSFTASLILLLLTCNLYSGGTWFFITVIPTLFGLSVLFLPFVLYQLPLTGFASDNKGLIYMVVNTVLLYATVIVGIIYSGNFAEYWRVAMLSTTVNILLPWALLGIIRYVRANGFIRAGLSAIVGGVFLSTISSVINLIQGSTVGSPFTNANLLTWSQVTIDANIFLITLFTGLITGGALLSYGLLRKK